MRSGEDASDISRTVQHTQFRDSGIDPVVDGCGLRDVKDGAHVLGLAACVVALERVAGSGEFGAVDVCE